MEIEKKWKQIWILWDFFFLLCLMPGLKFTFTKIYVLKIDLWVRFSHIYILCLLVHARRRRLFFYFWTYMRKFSLFNFNFLLLSLPYALIECKHQSFCYVAIELSILITQCVCLEMWVNIKSLACVMWIVNEFLWKSSEDLFRLFLVQHILTNLVLILLLTQIEISLIIIFFCCFC